MTNTNCSYLKRLQDENVIAVGYRPSNSRTLTDSLCKDDNNGGNHPLESLVKSRDPPKIPEVLEGIDHAIEALYPYTQFHDVCHDNYIKSSRR